MKHTLFILCFLCSKITFSQPLTDYIPQNTSYLFSIHFGQLNAKSNQLDYAKYLEPLIKGRTYSYYQSGEEASCEIISVKEMIKAPLDYAIDLNTNVYIYTTRVKEITGTIYLFRLDKPENFEAKLNTTCKDSRQIQKRHVGQASIYVTDEMSVAINGNICVIFIKDYSYSYNVYPVEESPEGFDDSIYMAEKAADNHRIDSLFYEQLNTKKDLDYEKEQAAFLERSDTGILFRAKQREDARMMEVRTKKFNVIFDLMEKLILPQQESMSGNRNFAKILEGKHDAFVYMNTLANLNSDFMNPFRWRSYRNETEDINRTPVKRVLTTDISSSYTIDFDNGKATLNVLSLYNKNVYPYMQKAYDVKQNKDLYKYIDAENLLGYMSLAVNAKELAKFYEDFYREILETYPKGKNDNDIMSGMELFYAMLDKEMLFNTLNGQAMFACTGFADIKVKYSTYDYDDEFKKTERIEERIEKQPKMVLAAAIGNTENAKKLYAIISRFSVFTRLKDNVFVFYGTEYSPVNVYFALTDDAFIVTNDANLVLNNLGGYPKNRQMQKPERKFISKHNIVFKIYGQKMLEGIQDTYFRNGETLPWFTQLMSNMGNLEMYDNKPGESSYQATAVMTLKDQSSNALYQLLKMMSSANEH